MRGRQLLKRNRTRTAGNRKSHLKRNLLSRLRHEPLEQRLVLNGTGLEGNPYAPDLDLSAIGALTATVGEEITLDLYASGAVATDLASDGTSSSGDTIRLQLDPDDNPAGATLTSDGTFSWTPSEDQVGLMEFVVLAVDEGSPPLADAEVFTSDVSLGNNSPDLAAIADTDATPGVELEVTVTATDADGDNLTYTFDPDAMIPDGATITQVDNGSAVISWTPSSSDALADYEFSVLVVDDGSPALSDRETFTVSVADVNTVPVATADSYSVVSGGQLETDATTGVLRNDTDADGDDLTAVLTSDPSSGTLKFNSDGSFTYVPNSSFTGTDSFTYAANDGIDDSTEVTVTLSVAAETNAPTATDDEYEVVEGSTLTVDSDSGVLANDSDADGDTLSPELVAGPSYGDLLLNSDGSFTYTPQADYYGSDSFTYTATDATESSNTATVTITVQENQAPVGVDDEYDVIAGDELNVAAADGVLANDTDGNGQTLTAAILSAPLYGVLDLASDGSFVYTASATYSGTDSFEYTAYDGSLSSGTVTVVINVRENNAPTTATEAFSVDMNGTLNVDADSGVLANDSDGDGDELSATLLSGPYHGTLQLNEDGSFTYTPVSDYSGADLFTYAATDGLLESESTTVSLTVVDSNATPEAYGDLYWVETDGTLAPSAAIGVIANDSDADGDLLTASLVSLPAHGTVSFASDGSFSYEPTTDYVGVDSFVYELSDGTDTMEAEVTIQVGTDFGPVVINEFVASGNETYADSEGEYYDWIEIHNLSDSDVDLANWALTDDEELATQWVFPSITLEAGGYLVVFASGNDATDPSADLHTNFKLSADGEYLAILNPDGEATTEFAPGYPESREGVAYGFDSTATEQYFVTPTPAESNTAEAIQDQTLDGLVITEINYNPTAATESELLVNSEFTEDDFEFVELTNVSDTAVALSDLIFASGIGFDFAESSVTTLAAGETLLLVSNQNAFEARYGTDLTIAGEFSGKLSNGGEQLTIMTTGSAVVLDCTYDDQDDWPTDADGAGYTLERIALDDANDPDDWDTGDLGGSPGSVPNWDTLVDAALEEE